MTDRASLDDERDFLLRSLADLDRERAAGDVSDADYVALRDEYTTRAAAVLRSIDGTAPATGGIHGGTASASEGITGDDSRGGGAGSRRTWVTVGVCVVLAALASFAVARFVAPRPVGGTVTGGQADSISTLLVQARQTQGTDKAAALKLYQQVLARDPDNAEARTYLGWLVANDVLQKGLSAKDAPALLVKAMDTSESQLDRAIALDPNYADPKCFKGIIRFRFFADAAGAKSAVDACLASNPPDVVKGLVSNLKADVDKALATG